jgi:DNA-binding transcriptional ArsR family regulator
MNPYWIVPRQDPVLTALADPTRWQLVSLLAERGESSATELARLLPVSRPAVVKHLALLGGTGVVTSRRVGREVDYRLEPARIASAARAVAALADRWGDRLATLKAIAESDS